MHASFIQTIPLSLVEQAIIFALSCYIMFTGRHEWAIGLHLSVALWTRNFFVFGVVSLWFLFGVALVAFLVDLHRRKAIIEIPKPDRWILVSMGLWLLLILVLINTFNPSDSRSMYRNLLLYTIFPMVSILVFARDVGRIRGFAVAFIVATLFNAWKALVLLEVDIAYLISDPTLDSIQQLGLYNYHWFAYTHAISFFLTLGLFLQVRSNPWVLGLLLVNAIINVYFLLLAGSRQALNGTIIVALPIVLWALTQHKMPHVRLIFLLICTIGVGMALYTTAPHLIVRSNEEVGDTFNIFSDRGQYWQIGWEYFVESPLWGHGFTAKYVHNLIVSTMANMGIAGMAFQAAMVYFIIKQCRFILRGDGTTEQAAWRIIFAGIVLFGHVHGMASGDIFSVWHIFWAGAMLWVLRDLTVIEVPKPLIQLPTRYIAQHRSKVPSNPV